MGMFDWVKVKYPLPKPEYQNERFQTKGLDNCMYEYIITEGGRLIRQEWDYRDVETIGTSWIDKLPHWEIIPESYKEVEVKFNGTITFYATIKTDKADKKYTFPEFMAVFEDGQLEYIEYLGDINVN